MKRIDGDRPTREEVIARKRALVRSLIELNGMAEPVARPVWQMTEAQPLVLAPIIPFPVGGRMND
jgi:hypothetical protein